MKEEKGLFYRFAVWAEGRLPDTYSGRRSFIHGLLAGQQQKELAICERLYGKGQKMARYRAMRIQRLQKILMVAVCGGTMTTLLVIYSLFAQKAVTGLARPESLSESKRYTLTAQLGQEPLGEIVMEIPGRRMTDAESEALLDEAQRQLETAILGKNLSLEQIYQDLTLPGSLCSGLVEICWESSDFETVDTRGKVYNDALEEQRVVTLTARLICLDAQRSVSFPVIVIPPERDQRERLIQEISRLLQEESQEEKMQEWFSLPDSFENLPLSWSLRQQPYGLWVLLLTAAGCVGIYAASFQDLQKEEQKRQQQLMQDYPGFMARLTMLAGTGMPIRLVFARLGKEGTDPGSSGDAAAGRKASFDEIMTAHGGIKPVHREIKPVYEEVLRTCREMESGITQKEAFENFGRRCRLVPYKKCASLLTQNLYRGSDGLLDALWQEAESACEERRALARQKGEEAQTKMLLPMMMMLLVVMVLVMVPACFSFAGM